MNPKHLTSNNATNVLAIFIIFLTSLELDLGPEYPEWLRDRNIEFEEFETILTPPALTFVFSKYVFLLEFIFSFVQLLPRYSQNPFVKEGVGHWFLVAAICEVFSSIFFEIDSAGEAFFSTVLLGFICASLIKILICQMKISKERDHFQSPEEYWLLRFPFNVHAGWSIAVFILAFNNFCVVADFSPEMQAIIAILSLLGFAAMAAKMLLFNGRKPNYAIPAVFSFFILGSAVNFLEADVDGELEPWLVLLLRLLMFTIGVGIALVTVYLIYLDEMVEEDDAKVTDSFQEYRVDRNRSKHVIDNSSAHRERKNDYHGGEMQSYLADSVSEPHHLC